MTEEIAPNPTNFHDAFHNHAVKQFIKHVKGSGLLPGLTKEHYNPILRTAKPHLQILTEHLADKGAGFSKLRQVGDQIRDAAGAGGFSQLREAGERIRDAAGVGGSLATDAHLKHAHGGRIIGGRIMGGAFDAGTWDLPNTSQEMYHFLLLMSPHQLEMFREIAAQILGGHHSPMWGKLVKPGEPMEADAEEYENIVRMPNQHAAARLLEAQAGGGWGGFYRATKHVGRIATKIYKGVRGTVKFAQNNRELINALIPDQYKDTVGTTFNNMLDTATKIDNAINPLIDAAIDASKDNATPESRQKLKQMAEKSIDTAVEKYLPNAKPYYDTAKEAATVAATGDKKKIAEYALGKADYAMQNYTSPEVAEKYTAAKQLASNANQAYLGAAPR